jgi:hypothetical protein
MVARKGREDTDFVDSWQAKYRRAVTSSFSPRLSTAETVVMVPLDSHLAKCNQC